MSLRLFFSAIAKFTLGVLLVGLLVFLPAGTFNFPNGIVFMVALFVPMFFAGIIMMIKNPELLKRRLNAREKRKTQDALVKMSGLMFVLGFVVAGLDFRFNFSRLPKVVWFIGVVLFLLAYMLYAVVLYQNTYLSRTIEVTGEHKLIDKGLYSIVRHPMYSATILLFLSMPLILGSLCSLIVFLLYPVIIVKRIKDEELLLERELDGYKGYKKKVKYRLIPFIW